MSVKTLDAVSHDGTLLQTTANGAVDGGWMSPANQAGGGRPSEYTYVFSLTSGTATFVLEGRNNPNDAPIQLDTATVSKTARVAAYRYYRARLTAAAAATTQCSLNVPVRS